MDNSWTTKLVDKYLVVNKRLGSGSFGIVYHALMKENYNHHLAAKTILSKVVSYCDARVSKKTNALWSVSPGK